MDRNVLSSQASDATKGGSRKRGINSRRVATASLLLLSSLMPSSCSSSSILDPLDCAAIGSMEDPETQPPVVVDQIQNQEEEDDQYYAIGTVDPGTSGGDGGDLTAQPSSALAKTQPPSMAPSVAQPCSDPLSNARGQYTSTLAPCTVKFHNANLQRQASAPQDEVDFIDYRTSNLCHDDNTIIEIKEYVDSWPDECVGDFERCYSLEHHWLLLGDFLCERDDDNQVSVPYQQDHQHPLSSSTTVSYRPHWAIPEGTTHVSVTCTKDKELVLEQNSKEERAEREERREAHREALQTRLFNGLIVFVSALTIIYALSQLIVAPLVTVATAVVSSSSSSGGRNNSLPSHHDDGASAESDGDHLSARMSSGNNRRRGQTAFLDRRSSSISSLPLHTQEVEALVLENNTVVGEVVDSNVHEDGMETVSSLHDPSSGSIHYHHRRRRSTHVVDDEASTSSYPMDDQEEEAVNDFDSQIPLDFDAVPIPIVPAMVLNDGITYT